MTNPANPPKCAKCGSIVCHIFGCPVKDEPTPAAPKAMCDICERVNVDCNCEEPAAPEQAGVSANYRDEMIERGFTIDKLKAELAAARAEVERLDSVYKSSIAQRMRFAEQNNKYRVELERIAEGAGYAKDEEPSEVRIAREALK